MEDWRKTWKQLENQDITMHYFKDGEYKTCSSMLLNGASMVNKKSGQLLTNYGPCLNNPLVDCDFYVSKKKLMDSLTFEI